MSLLDKMRGWIGEAGRSEGDPVFVLGPRMSGKSIFLGSLFDAPDVQVIWSSSATDKWESEMAQTWFEKKPPKRTDYISSAQKAKEEARANFHQLASEADDEALMKRMMLDIRVRFPAHADGIHRVCLPDPSGELFLHSELLKMEGYERYADALTAAAGYIVVVGGDREICKIGAGPEATAVHKMLSVLKEHAANSDYIATPVAVVLMKMDLHMDCCLKCPDQDGAGRTSFLRKAGLDSDLMASLFGQWFHRRNRRSIESIVDPKQLRFFGASAYGFAPDGSPACTPAASGSDFAPTDDAQPVNIAEPLKWALGVR